MKKNSVFYIVSISLLGLSNCMTASLPILFMNKCGIFLLFFVLILHTVYDDKEWNFPKYFCAIFRTLGGVFSCLLRPFGDMVSYFDARKQEKETKKNYFLPALIGFSIAVPILFFVTLLLASADVVFEHMLSDLINILNLFSAIRIFFLMTVVFFSSYAIVSALCKKEVKEKTEEKTGFDAVIAIVITSLLCLVYMAFSTVQIRKTILMRIMPERDFFSF